MITADGHMRASGLYENEPPWKQVLATLVVLFIMFVPVSMLSLLFVGPDGMDYSSEEQVNVMRWLQFAQSILLFAVPAFIAARLFSARPLEYLNVKSSATLPSYIIVLFLMASALPLINMLGELNLSMELPAPLSKLEEAMRGLEDLAMEQTEAFLAVESPYLLLVNILVMAVAPALTEELLFRGVFQRLFIAWTGKAIVGIIITAAFFSAFHMQFFGFLPRFFLGLVLGFLYLWSRSIWLPVLAHFTNNAIVVIAYYYIHNYASLTEVETAGTSEGSLQMLIWGGLLFFVLATLVYRGETPGRTAKGV